MARVRHACEKGIDSRCMKAYPAFGRRAVAYRTVWSMFSDAIIRFLGKGLDRALVGRGVDLPPGVEFPGGWVVFPDVDFPSGWVFGDPLPPGVLRPPAVRRSVGINGASEPLFVGVWSGGPKGRRPIGGGLLYASYFGTGYWDEIAVPGYELGSIRWVTDHWKVFYAHEAECNRWGALEVKSGTTWADGFRPRSCRVTFSGGSGTVRVGLCDTSYNSLGHNLNAVSPALVSLNFASGLDIWRFNIRDDVLGSHSAMNFVITNIEFG